MSGRRENSRIVDPQRLRRRLPGIFAFCPRFSECGEGANQGEDAIRLRHRLSGAAFVTIQISYGEEFLQHLTALSQQTPFNYHDLQQVKIMDRDALAERLKKECPGIADYVRSHSAKETAEIVHAKRMEVARAASGTSVQGATCSLLEFVTQLFSVMT